jgi:hypothetical protein
MFAMPRLKSFIKKLYKILIYSGGVIMCEQRTLEWWAARLGNITGSQISDIMPDPKKGILSQTALSYMNMIIAERLTSIPKLIYSKSIEHGILNEPIARRFYEQKTGKAVIGCGSIRNAEFIDVSGSPDGLIGDDGIIEIKCPNSHTHINTLLTNEIDNDYIYQIQFSLWNLNRKYCDFISFDPRVDDDNLKIKIIRIERDEITIQKIVKKIKIFREVLNQKMIQLTGSEEWEIDEGKLETFLIENGQIHVNLII